ncbi:MAG: L-2-hydroxyglutarate oxidase [Saprospiraceae bacterium]|jgi:L-2-hydroxyglutarate oxidase
MTQPYDITIVGAGIVGLATAYQLLEKRPNLRISILEKEGAIAQHQTGNNSGVIHSGIYYKPGSAKAINCKKGYQLLLDFCEAKGIDYELCGKVIVATEEKELPALERIYERGVENGLTGLTYLNEAELKEKEPHVKGIKGIWVPQAGIVSYKDVSQKYKEEIEAKGGEVKLGYKVLGIDLGKELIKIKTSQGNIVTKFIVNCGGLYADKLAQMTGQGHDFKILPFRGEYYELIPEKHYLVKSLIYPVPNPEFPFLGVHFTKMIKGGVEAGPNAVLAFKREGYKNTQFNLKELIETITYSGFIKIAAKYWKDGSYEMYRSFSKRAFVKALQKLIPTLKGEDIVKGGAGVRAQACDKNGNLIDDFLILEKNRVINVCNAPSPAATSSLAIGQTISEMILSKI